MPSRRHDDLLAHPSVELAIATHRKLHVLIDTQLSGTTAQLASLGLLHKAIDSTNQEESLSRLSLELYTLAICAKCVSSHYVATLISRVYMSLYI